MPLTPPRPRTISPGACGTRRGCQQIDEQHAGHIVGERVEPAETVEHQLLQGGQPLKHGQNQVPVLRRLLPVQTQTDKHNHGQNQVPVLRRLLPVVHRYSRGQK